MLTINHGRDSKAFEKEMMLHLRCLVTLVILLWINSCAYQPVSSEPPAYQVVKTGQLLQLNENLTVFPDKATVYIQNGKLVFAKAIDQWAPNCRIVVQEITDKERVIQPDTFRIIRINYDRYLAFVDPIMVASHKLRSALDGDGPTAEIYETAFILQSDQQPFVKQLICKHWEDPHDGAHLTLRQIQQALGNIFEIKE